MPLPEVLRMTVPLVRVAFVPTNNVVPTVAAPVTPTEANVEAPVTPSVVPTVAAPVMEAEPAVTSPVTVNAPLAVGDDERRLFSVTFLVVPVAAIDVSETSTMTSGSTAGSVEVLIDASAVILESAIGQKVNL